LGILMLALLCGCNNNYVPKPRGYFRFDFPQKQYVALANNFPYTFEYPAYGISVKDTDKNAEPYWMNIEFKHFRAKIHLSYKSVNKNVSTFIEDAHSLAYKHSVKADAIETKLIADKERNVYGLLYEIEGNAACSVQFYATDSVRHFLRGALYFDCSTNKDSLEPAIQFFQQDIDHLIKTLHWK